MKKRVMSIVCVAVFAAVITFACIGTEPAEASQQGTITGQQGTITGQQEPEAEADLVVYADGPYILTTPEGYPCIEYDVYNASEVNVWVDLSVNCFDQTDTNIAAFSSYIPCIAPGSTVGIYAVDYNGYVYDNNSYVYAMVMFSESDYESAGEDLAPNISVSVEDGYLQFTAVNRTSGLIWMPQVTVQFHNEDESQWWIVSVMLAEGGVNYLDIGNVGSARVMIPEGASDYYYDVTGIYDETASGSE